ncbi:MAG: peptidase M20 family protein [halophilic archaeon J07HX5]|nr:MAG: peptidase M20 family protein [halophilic archaeon J07HX5]
MLNVLTHNRVTITRVRDGNKKNVVLGTVRTTLDCRLVPGQTPADVIDELATVIGQSPSGEVLRFDPGPPNADIGLFDHLTATYSAMACQCRW